MSFDDDLTGAEIAEFVTKVRNLPGCTNVEKAEVEKAAPLFLRARKRDVDRAVELFNANKRMRYTEKVDSIDPLEDGVRRELLSGKFTVLPSCPSNSDSDNGEPCPTLAIFTANRHWPPLTTHRDTLKGVLYQLDVAMMDEHSQRQGLIVLYDMRDAKYGNFDYHLCLKLLNLFKGVYPARLRKVIIVEAPIWFRAPFGVLRLFVKEKIRDRVSTVDLDDMHNLLPASLIQSLFHQMTEHRHFDWLRQCLDKTGHAALAPADYFVTHPPPVFTSLPEFEIVSQQSGPLRSGGVKTARYSSLRYSQSTRLRCSSDLFRNADTSSPPSSHQRPPSDEFQADSLPRRDSRSLNRMLTSMYHSVYYYHSPTKPCPPTSPVHEPWSWRVTKTRSPHMINNNGIHTTTTTPTSSTTSPPGESSSPSSPRATPESLLLVNTTDPLSQTRLSVSEFLARVNALGTVGLCAEFESMFRDKPLLGTCNRFLQVENRRRNRYLDVPCLDATAVDLPDGTYLHANWVHGYKSPRSYILAQGPLDNTRRDFWMAVWEYRVPVIVMLTRIVEGQRVKCTPYWPSRSVAQPQVIGSSSAQLQSNLRHCTAASGAAATPTDISSTGGSENLADSTTLSSATSLSSTAFYGEFQVTNLGETIEENGLYRRSRLELRRRQQGTRRGIKRLSVSSHATSLEDSDAPLIVDHLLYLGWPDFDVPSDSDGFLKFLHVVNQLHQTRCQELTPLCNGGTKDQQGVVASWSSVGKLPMLIHCSAGIGRTGTFVTVDVCLQQARAEGFVDVPAVVTRLREQRAGAVQVAKQYAFIHTALASSLVAAATPDQPTS